MRCKLCINSISPLRSSKAALAKPSESYLTVATPDLPCIQVRLLLTGSLPTVNYHRHVLTRQLSTQEAQKRTLLVGSSSAAEARKHLYFDRAADEQPTANARSRTL